MLRITSLQRILLAADASVPPYLDTPNSHQWCTLEIIATFSSCRCRWCTFLRRTKWKLSRPSRVWRDHLQFSAFRFVTLSMDAYFSPIPSK